MRPGKGRARAAGITSFRRQRWQEAGEAFLEFAGGFGFAFPDREDAPTEALESEFGGGVALGVAVQLGFPEGAVAGGDAAGGAMGVLMPEAAMDENDGAAGAEDEVRFAGQVAALEPVAEAQCGDELADDFFRFGVVAADAGHVARPFFRGEPVQAFGRGRVGRWSGHGEEPRRIPVLRGGRMTFRED